MRKENKNRVRTFLIGILLSLGCNNLAKPTKETRKVTECRRSLGPITHLGKSLGRAYIGGIGEPFGRCYRARIIAIPNVLQHWQQLQAIREVNGVEKGVKSAQYKGAATSWIGVAGNSDKNSSQRKIDDGILLVVPVRIYGHKVRTLIDSKATQSFIASGAVLPLGWKSMSKDTLLELGNRNRILFPGESE